jgi:hypothetical protein
MRDKNVIEFSVVEVEVVELQHCNLVWVCLNYAGPLQDVRSDQGVLKISGNSISIYCVT